MEDTKIERAIEAVENGEQKPNYDPILLLSGKIINNVVNDIRSRNGLMQVWKKLPKKAASEIVKEWLTMTSAELSAALKVNESEVKNDCPQSASGHDMQLDEDIQKLACIHCGGC